MKVNNMVWTIISLHHALFWTSANHLHNSFLDQSLKVASTIIDLDKKNGEFNQTMHVRSYKKDGINII